MQNYLQTNILKSKQGKGFTLVELIISIVILIILATIALISLKGYVKDARDTKRKTDLKNIENTIILYNIKNGSYPEPNNKSLRGEEINGIVYKKGFFGTGLLEKIKGISNLPLDPKTEKPYEYLLSNGGKKYLLRAELEKLDKDGKKFFILGNYKNENINDDGCQKGQHMNLITDLCEPDIKLCGIIENGRNEKIWNNSTNSRGECNIICNVNYHKDGGICKGGIVGNDSIGRNWIDGTYARNCNEYKNDIQDVNKYVYKGDIGDGIYSIKPNLNTILKVYCNMSNDGGGWTLVFKKNAKVLINPYNLWAAEEYDTNNILSQYNNYNINKINLFKDKSKQNDDYANDLRFHLTGIENIRLEINKSGLTEKYIKFLSSGNYKDFISQEKVISSSWTDLKTLSYNFFSVIGDIGYTRFFFLHHKYGGCDIDEGWLVVMGGKEACLGVWESQYDIIYSGDSTKTVYSKGNRQLADNIMIYYR